MESGRHHDEIGGQLRAVRELDRALVDVADLDAASDADVALRDEIRGADIDVIARAGAECLHHEAGFVLAEIELKAGLCEAIIESRVSPAHFLIDGNLTARHETEGRRSEGEIGVVGRDSALKCILRIERLEAELHQRLRPNDGCRGPLQHSDPRAVLP